MPSVLALDASGNLQEKVSGLTYSVATVAAAGSVIANAAAISANVGLTIVTGADDTKGVILPAAVPGKEIKIYQDAATAGLKVYGQVNSTINQGSANAAIVMEGRTLATFIGTSGTNWAAAFTINA